ncbi:hypothetical protein LX32DRAFT_633276 [Colletotrichum zoysiae]|uniref:Uncharacterized protein n=1 Tax=Colletotrichum zoysiae TaxID=1216348 RepID=A0AAD9HUU4_9PEZI|nr:hypothetical protein LX32DRAFT_633276 [Colletotrichum zoysiae]
MMHEMQPQVNHLREADATPMFPARPTRPLDERTLEVSILQGRSSGGGGTCDPRARDARSRGRAFRASQGRTFGLADSMLLLSCLAESSAGG